MFNKFTSDKRISNVILVAGGIVLIALFIALRRVLAVVGFIGLPISVGALMYFVYKKENVQYQRYAVIGVAVTTIITLINVAMLAISPTPVPCHQLQQ